MQTSNVYLDFFNSNLDRYLDFEVAKTAAENPNRFSESQAPAADFVNEATGRPIINGVDNTSLYIAGGAVLLAIVLFKVLD